MESTSFSITGEIQLFKQKALQWANRFSVLCALDSNQDTKNKYSEYEFLLAVDAIDDIIPSPNERVFERLQHKRSSQKAWHFGFLTYDLKNEIENLASNNPDYVELPRMYFFEPRYLIFIKGNQITFNRNYPESADLFDQINAQVIDTKHLSEKIALQSKLSKEAYLDILKKIKQHILEGDLYEVNICRELFATNVNIDPLSIYFALNEKTSAPFSSYFKLQDQFIVGASPERFLKKKKNKLISQPIKGTIKRSVHVEEDELLKSELYFNEKERAENVMIVDLVRNDLTHFAIPGSIKVEELYRVYSFKTVHHLISTVSATLNEEENTISAIAAAFPMGSMTGAPKIKAMQLIEQYEVTKRGLYSGAIGYFTPDNDFDFNVVIRTILYNQKNKYLSIQSGGAITIDSIPENEWDELNLKSQALAQILNL